MNVAQTITEVRNKGHERVALIVMGKAAADLARLEKKAEIEERKIRS